MPKRKRLRARKAARANLPDVGFVRLPLILRLIPISRSGWWKGIELGRYPAPVKLSPGVTAWRVEDIRGLITRLGGKSV
jgi:prophage regulatory protein